MEWDADVLEFYDQASRIPLSYRAKSGQKTTQWHTPDFFLPKESAGWEEWKPAQPSIGCIERLVDSTSW
jgi:putative transposase